MSEEAGEVCKRNVLILGDVARTKEDGRH
jgi:hypothetical protein